MLIQVSNQQAIDVLIWHFQYHNQYLHFDLVFGNYQNTIFNIINDEKQMPQKYYYLP